MLFRKKRAQIFSSEKLLVKQSNSSAFNNAIYKLKRNKLAMAGFIVLIILSLISLFTPLIAPYSYETQDLYLGATPPSWKHLCGTDDLGRDLLTRMLYGGRISLAVGIAATTVSIIIGGIWGTVSGYFGGKVDQVMMRIVDILYALPFMIFIILLMVVFGRNLILLFISIGAVEWLTMARIVRGQVLAIRKEEFIDAAITQGLSPQRIIIRHIIPNVMGVIIIYSTLTVPSVMLLEAFLSFLGLGVQPPMSSWGLLISGGVETMEEYPWLLIFPGILLSITLFSFNFLGDGLRDAFDPKSTGGKH